MENKQFTFTTVSALQMILFGSLSLLLTLLAGIYLAGLLIPDSIKIKLEKFEVVGYLLLCIPGFFAMLYGYSFAGYTTIVELNNRKFSYSTRRDRLNFWGEKRIELSWADIKDYAVTEEEKGAILKITDKQDKTHQFTFSYLLEKEQTYLDFLDVFITSVTTYNEHRADYATENAEPIIAQSSNFYGSTTAKILGVFIISSLVVIPFIMWQLNSITSSNILKMIWLYPTGIYLLYRIFKRKK